MRAGYSVNALPGPEIEFEGSTNDILPLLAPVIYTPKPHFWGVVRLSITINDWQTSCFVDVQGVLHMKE